MSRSTPEAGKHPVAMRRTFIPPAQRLLQEADGRPRRGYFRVFVRPWPNDGAYFDLEPIEYAEDSVFVSIGHPDTAMTGHWIAAKSSHTDPCSQ